jgi:hypothetical protein
MDINKPLDRDITIKMNIFARDSENRVYKLFFHSEVNIESKTNQILDYSDRLIKGDIIAKQVADALNEDLGIDKILQMKLTEPDEIEDLGIDDPIIRELSKEINNEREVVIEVIYEPDLEDNFEGKLFKTWLEISPEVE